MIIAGAIAAAVILALVVVIFIDSRQQASSTAPEGVEEFDVGGAGQHTEGTVEYAQNPPAGGEHHPNWQNCGFYTQPVRNETAVHSLEHGAVWITYSPDLPADQLETIGQLATNQSYVLASPYEDLPSPIVASAWGYQLQLDSANDPALEQFLRAYVQGPQTPEPGAACTGGVGTPS
ncbi:Protein of unknown function (DUF3105) [Rubrobacter radiotolerans]|uniref:DUF3105 domain-containing protein n=1 Tax=Rubrobacter radiotolerans TaxID=42256 RepID=A0A023X4P9_RUBRA|nr:Protein of unknown function (DUF3105) [Rubrobacter radiotolerans]SMC05861.1 Protein of unknown function [Rubrobacter radiotolerans DSM 5868]